MVEAGLVSVVLLACTWWACRHAGIVSARQDASRTAQTVGTQNALTHLEATILASADDTRDVLRQLVRAVQDQHHADLITTLATALQAEVDQIVARQNDHNNEWFDLATRVQNGAGHRTLRFPS